VDRAEVQSRTVKIVGTSARDSIEGFETGLLISSTGDVVTVVTPLLESKNLRVVLTDDRSFPAKLLGIDSKRRIAYLRTAAADVPFFDLSRSAPPLHVGDAVWGTTNRVELMQGAKPVDSMNLTLLRIDDPTVAADSNDRQPSRYLIEGVPNRAGAFGGALTTSTGQLIGMIAGPDQNKTSEAPARQAIPASEIRDAISDIMQGKGNTAELRPNHDNSSPKERTAGQLRGIILLPEILDQTPAYIDGIRPDSPADRAGLRPDDLVLYAGSTLIRSTNDLTRVIATIPDARSVLLVVMRGEELKEIELGADAALRSGKSAISPLE